MVDRRVRAFLGLFGLGLLGVLALLLDGLRDPAMFRELAAEAGISTTVVIVAAATQTAILLAIAVIVGLVTAPRVGFRSHVHAAIPGARATDRSFRRELHPAVAIGAAIGGLLIVAEQLPPPAIAEARPTVTATELLASLPLRLLYGGITEELLLRWGVMSLLTFALWWLAGGGDRPTGRIVWPAIVAAAILFGILHLPLAATIYGTLTPEVLAFIVGLNAVAGIGFGWLFWRYSLEAAMVAHALAHVIAVAVWVITLVLA